MFIKLYYVFIYFYLEGGFFFKSLSASFAFCKSRQAKITLAPIYKKRYFYYIIIFYIIYYTLLYIKL